MSKKRLSHELQTKLCMQIIEQQGYLQRLYLYLTAEDEDIEHALNTLTNLLVRETHKKYLLNTITEIAEHYGYSRVENNVYGFIFESKEEVEA